MACTKEAHDGEEAEISGGADSAAAFFGFHTKTTTRGSGKGQRTTAPHIVHGGSAFLTDQVTVMYVAMTTDVIALGARSSEDIRALMVTTTLCQFHIAPRAASHTLDTLSLSRIRLAQLPNFILTTPACGSQAAVCYLANSYRSFDS